MATSHEISEKQLVAASAGFHAILNDDIVTAKRILAQEESAFHAIGMGLITFLEAALGQEDADLALSVTALGTAERLASAQHKKAVREKRGTDGYPPGLEYEIVKADATFAQAITNFLGESYFQYLSGVYKLRSSYKMFESTFRLAYPHGTQEVDKKSRPDSLVRTPSSGLSKGLSWISLSSYRGRPAEVEETLPEPAQEKAGAGSEQAVANDAVFKQFILSGAAFGYGCFSLIFSLLPPKIKKVIGLFGLKGDRKDALAHLQTSAWASDDVHGSFAALVLLTYWTAVMMFINYMTDLKGTMVKCEALLDKMQKRYPQGQLWLLNRAKIQKMKGDNLGAIRTLEAGVGSGGGGGGTGGFKQMKGLLYFELGWNYLIELDYLKTHDTFTHKMTELNSWSPVTYAWIGLGCFLAAPGAAQHVSEAQKLWEALPGLMNRKKIGSQGQPPTETFVRRKMKFYEGKHKRWLREKRVRPDSSPLVVIRVPPVQEMMYFWNLHAHMSASHLDQLISGLESLKTGQEEVTNGKGKELADLDTPDEVAVRELLLGVCHRAKKDLKEARSHLTRCLELEREVLEDRWAIPYAMYELAVVEILESANRRKAEEWMDQCSQRGNIDLEARLGTRLQMFRDELAAM